MTWSELLTFLNVLSLESMPAVLVLGSDGADLKGLTTYLTARGYRVEVVGTHDALLSRLNDLQADAVCVTDVPAGVDLTELVASLRCTRPQTPVLVARALTAGLAGVAKTAIGTLDFFDTPSRLHAALQGAIQPPMGRGGLASAD